MENHRRDLVNACVDLIPGVNRQMQTDYVNALMELVDRADPDYVIDIGTNYGVSCLAQASAMHLQGKDISNVTTIDIHRGLWMQTRQRWDHWFDKFGMNLDKIRAMEADFKIVLQQLTIPEGKQGMVFFDIHDLDDSTGVPNSPIFVEKWLPLITGIVAVHDINACDKDWQRPAHWGTVCSADVVELWTGQWFRGFGEVKTFIDLLNKHRVEPRVIPGTSIIWFDVEAGIPKG